MKPYSRVVRDRLRNLKAESPSKKDVSGTTLDPPASRLNHPLPGAIVFYYSVGGYEIRERLFVEVES